MGTKSKLFTGMKHWPSAAAGWKTECTYFCIALGIFGLALVAMAALNLVSMTSIRVHMAVLPGAFALIGGALMFTDKLPSTRAAADYLVHEKGEEHLALWMGLSRLALVPASFVLAVLLRREIFYFCSQFKVEVVTGSLALIICASVYLRVRYAQHRQSERFITR